MNLKKILVPTLTLTVITLVVTALLVLTNGMTKDKIAALELQAEEKAKREVLAAADDFVEQTIMIDGQEITYYEAGNGVGYVFSTSSKGYGGAVVVMSGITSEGEIAGIKITSQNETPGLGQKALKTSFTKQYKKIIPDGGILVTKSGSPADDEIDAIAGATITTNAVTNAVNEAINIYHEVTGGGN